MVNLFMNFVICIHLKLPLNAVKGVLCDVDCGKCVCYYAYLQLSATLKSSK